MLTAADFLRFRQAFFAEDLPTLRRLIIRDPSWAHDDPLLEPASILLTSPLALLRNNRALDREAIYTDVFARDYTSFVLSMGFDPDTEFAPLVGSYVEFVWRAKNTAMAAQLLLGKIEKDWTQKGQLYNPNLNAVMCNLAESDNHKLNLWLRGSAITDMARVHDAVRQRLNAPQLPRERRLAAALPTDSFFRRPFPYGPQDYALFAKPPANYIDLLTRALAATDHLADEEVDLLMDNPAPTDSRTLGFAGKSVINLGRAADEVMKRNLAAVRASPRRRPERPTAPTAG
jgi:hypothetical protein